MSNKSTNAPISSADFMSDQLAARAISTLSEADRANLRDLSIINRCDSESIAKYNLSVWGPSRLAHYASTEDAKLAAVIMASFRLGERLENRHFDEVVAEAWG